MELILSKYFLDICIRSTFAPEWKLVLVCSYLLLIPKSLPKLIWILVGKNIRDGAHGATLGHQIIFTCFRKRPEKVPPQKLCTTRVPFLGPGLSLNERYRDLVEMEQSVIAQKVVEIIGGRPFEVDKAILWACMILYTK